MASALKTRRIDEGGQPSTHRDGQGELAAPRGCAGIDGRITHCLRHTLRARPLAVVIVDYLQLVKPASIKAPRAAGERDRARPERAGDGS